MGCRSASYEDFGVDAGDGLSSAIMRLVWSPSLRNMEDQYSRGMMIRQAGIRMAIKALRSVSPGPGPFQANKQAGINGSCTRVGQGRGRGTSDEPQMIMGQKAKTNVQ